MILFAKMLPRCVCFGLCDCKQLTSQYKLVIYRMMQLCHQSETFDRTIVLLPELGCNEFLDNSLQSNPTAMLRPSSTYHGIHPLQGKSLCKEISANTAANLPAYVSWMPANNTWCA